MKIVQTYSHLNGLEYLLVHKKRLWVEIQAVIRDYRCSYLSHEGEQGKTDGRSNQVQPCRHES